MPHVLIYGRGAAPSRIELRSGYHMYDFTDNTACIMYTIARAGFAYVYLCPSLTFVLRLSYVSCLADHSEVGTIRTSILDVYPEH